MKLCIVALFALAFTTSAFADIQTRTIEYKAGDATMKGFLAWDDAQDVQKPAVVIIHEWWGNDDYSHTRARQLAELGYVGFAIDMYGDGWTTQDPKQASQRATELRKNPDLARQRLQAALDTLKQQPQVDADQLAAIGYCFGGTMALNMARWGMGLDGVVAFHADLSNPHAQKSADRIETKILVAHGGDDPFVPDQQLEAFKQEMNKAGADFNIKVYPGAVHSFTNPQADKHGIDGVKYHAAADRASWEDMKAFLGGLFNR